GNPVIAASVAVSAAVGMMFALRCLHPPGGGMALTAVVSGSIVGPAGAGAFIAVVGVNSLILLLVALVFNNATRRRYPHLPQADHSNIHHTKDARPTDRLNFKPADLDDVLAKYD